MLPDSARTYNLSPFQVLYNRPVCVGHLDVHWAVVKYPEGGQVVGPSRARERVLSIYVESNHKVEERIATIVRETGQTCWHPLFDRE